MEAIAARANCSVDRLYAVFGSRDDLVSAVFERHTPLVDIEDVLAAGHPDLTATVRHVYRQLAEALNREPRVTPAILAEALARPTSPAVQAVLRHSTPRVFAVMGRWLTAEVQAGRIRDLPTVVLIHECLAPVVVHMLLRPAAVGVPIADLPDIDRTCVMFADAFIRAAAAEPPREGCQQ